MRQPHCRPVWLPKSEQLRLAFMRYSEMNDGHTSAELFEYLAALEHFQAEEDAARQYPGVVSPAFIEESGFKAWWRRFRRRGTA
jgi:hypothetical protein